MIKKKTYIKRTYSKLEKKLSMLVSPGSMYETSIKGDTEKGYTSIEDADNGRKRTASASFHDCL